VGLAGQAPAHRLHFTPTSASWLNLVEVFFSIIERQALRRGDFASVTDLITAIGRFCAAWNQHCQPFAWTKPADQILARSTETHLRGGVANPGRTCARDEVRNDPGTVSCHHTSSSGRDGEAWTWTMPGIGTRTRRAMAMGADRPVGLGRRPSSPDQL
jgi:hypothetical protein